MEYKPWPLVAFTKRPKHWCVHGVTRFNGSRHSYFERMIDRSGHWTSADQALLHILRLTLRIPILFGLGQCGGRRFLAIEGQRTLTQTHLHRSTLGEFTE